MGLRLLTTLSHLLPFYSTYIDVSTTPPCGYVDNIKKACIYKLFAVDNFSFILSASSEGKFAVRAEVCRKG